MKIFAIGALIKPLTPELRQKFRPIEVAATIKLYFDSKIEQFWFRGKCRAYFPHERQVGRRGQGGH